MMKRNTALSRRGRSRSPPAGTVQAANLREVG